MKKNNSLSTLGFIMDFLGIQTVAMSRALHVDASLVSKWKTGDRTLSSKSVYFDDVIKYILVYSEHTDYQMLKNALSDLNPHIHINDLQTLEKQLRILLSNNQKPRSAEKKNQHWASGGKSVRTYLFDGDNGRREAIDKLLSYAETMSVSGDLIFMDSSEYDWLVKDPSYAQQFTQRILSLLYRGFHAKFVIHFSAYRERFIEFFNVCSPLLFHRNVEWYYYEYYDDAFFNYSFFILNHAVSILGLSASNLNSSTMIYTDHDLVIRHETLANDIIQKCGQMFTKFDPFQLSDVVEDIYHSRRKGTFYSFLPAPAFVSVKENLLTQVLKENNVSSELMDECYNLNHKLREVTSDYFRHISPFPKDSFIHVFQLEELIRRSTTVPFYSGSLSLLGNRSVSISPSLYAQALKDLANGLQKHENLSIVLVSKKDHLSLPALNCWCKKNSWILLMDQKGFRLSDEISIVNAVSITLDQCLRKIPPERKEKKSVRQFLLDLAYDLENGNYTSSY